MDRENCFSPKKLRIKEKIKHWNKIIFSKYRHLVLI